MTFDKKTLRNLFLLASGCIVLYWILHETERFNAVYGTVKDILSPFVIGAGLAFIINVPMRFVEKLLSGVKNKSLRRGLSILITSILFLLVLALVFWLLIPQVVDTAKTFAESLPGFFENVIQKANEFLADNPDLLKWFNENVIQAFNPDKIAGMLEGAWEQISSSVSVILTGAFSAIGTVTSFLFNAVVSLVFAIYCLAQKEKLACQFKKLVYALLPERYADYAVRVMRLANGTFSNFLSGQFVEVCILGCMFAVSMAIFRMPYISLVSVLVAITAFIPMVGAFVGCFFGALFILVEDPQQAFVFVIMFLILQQIENNLIYPRVVGAHTGLPGMWVLLAVAVGGELMGVSGMFLMIPMASVAYTLLGEFANSRLVAKGVPQEKYSNVQTPPPQTEESIPTEKPETDKA